MPLHLDVLRGLPVRTAAAAAATATTTAPDCFVVLGMLVRVCRQVGDEADVVSEALDPSARDGLGLRRGFRLTSDASAPLIRPESTTKEDMSGVARRCDGMGRGETSSRAVT